MIYLIVFYWLVTGFAFYLIPSYPIFGVWRNILFFFICLGVGGVAIPARMVLKAIR